MLQLEAVVLRVKIGGPLDIRALVADTVQSLNRPLVVSSSLIRNRSGASICRFLSIFPLVQLHEISGIRCKSRSTARGCRALPPDVHAFSSPAASRCFASIGLNLASERTGVVLIQCAATAVDLVQPPRSKRA